MRRITVRLLAVALLILNLGAGAVVALHPRMLNWGPEGNILASTGRHVHRHDLLCQWRIVGIVVAERVIPVMYVYRGGNFCADGPTPVERAEYVASRGPSPAERAMRAVRGSPHARTGAAIRRVVVYWAPLLGVLLLGNVAAALVWISGTCVVHLIRSRRARPGTCRWCGYDLRASYPFGRCPECGRSIERTEC
jgi:hypothetical protein